MRIPLTDTIYKFMTDHDFPFITQIHRLYSFRTLSMFFNLINSNKIVEKLMPIIAPSVLYSRTDVFFFKNNCKLFIEYFNFKRIFYTALLRNLDEIEVLFYLIIKNDLQEFISKINNNLLVCYLQMKNSNTADCYPEKILYKILKSSNKKLIKSNISFDFDINVSKYNEITFCKELHNYISYILKYNHKFIFCDVDDTNLFIQNSRHINFNYIFSNCFEHCNTLFPMADVFLKEIYKYDNFIFRFITSNNKIIDIDKSNI